MPTQLREMIDLQPEALRTVAGFDVGPQADILRRARRIFVVGTGTSFHAAELGAGLLMRYGIDAWAVPSIEAARWRIPFRDDDAVIVISHTGETAFARATRHAALEQGWALVTITGPDAGWPEAIKTPVRERSETYTVSYTAAVAVLGLLAHAITDADTGPDTMYEVADHVEAVIADPKLSHIDVPARALAIVGPGAWSITAREGALKVREAALILAEGFDPERLLHGAAVPYGREDTLVVLQPEWDAERLTSGLLTAAAAEWLTVHPLSDEVLGNSPAQVFAAQIPATVRLQLLAARLSELKKTNPDTAIVGAWARPELWSAGAPPE